jgi:hypothetical protein
MDIELMMDRVQLRSLDEILHPMWRPDVRVIEQLAGRSEKIEPERAPKRASEQWVHDVGRQRAVRQNLYRMFVEGGHSLDARRRMVNLVEDNPEAGEVADAMPPVEDECADEPAADESLQHGTLESGRWNSETPDSRSSQRWLVAKVMATWTRLIRIARRSPGRMRQFPAWRDALQRQKAAATTTMASVGRARSNMGSIR